MGKQISAEIIKQIPILYEKYHNKSQVARDLGISAASVDKYLKELDVMPAQRKERTKITPEIEAEINRLYSEYPNLSEVGKKIGIAPQTVKKHLSEENLNLLHTQYDDKEALCYFIYKLFGCEPVSQWNLTQIERFKKQGINYKAQLLSLKYFFEVKKSPVEKAHSSVGIIPWVYSEAKAYYLSEAKRREEFEVSLKKQLEQDRITINYNPRDYWGGGRKKKKEIDLNSIGED